MTAKAPTEQEREDANYILDKTGEIQKLIQDIPHKTAREIIKICEEIDEAVADEFLGVAGGCVICEERVFETELWHMTEEGDMYHASCNDTIAQKQHEKLK